MPGIHGVAGMKPPVAEQSWDTSGARISAWLCPELLKKSLQMLSQGRSNSQLRGKNKLLGAIICAAVPQEPRAFDSGRLRVGLLHM